METNKLNEIEFLVLQTLANQVWFGTLLIENNAYHHLDYIVKKIKRSNYSNFDDQPIYLVNQFDPQNQAKLFRLILNFHNKEIKEKLIEFFRFCAGDSYDNCWLCKKIGIEFKESEKPNEGEENGKNK